MLDLGSLFNYVTMVAAAATIIAVQILKSPLMPVKFQNHPVPTTIVTSAVAGFIALISQHFSFVWSHWTQIVGEFVAVLVVAVITYNNTIQQWPEAKALEAPKTKTLA